PTTGSKACLTFTPRRPRPTRDSERNGSMELGIEGKIAVVVGGSSGLGRETARALTQEGVKVLIAARRAERVNETVAEIRGEGGNVAGVSADMTTEEGVSTMMDACRERLGGVPEIAISSLRPDSSNVAPGEKGGDGEFLDVPDE